MTLYSVSLISPSASSSSRAVSTSNPCWEKYSLIEKQIDSSSSTTSSLVDPASARSVSATAACSRLRKSSRRRPDTVLNVNIVGITYAGCGWGNRNPPVVTRSLGAELVLLDQRSICAFDYWSNLNQTIYEGVF